MQEAAHRTSAPASSAPRVLRVVRGVLGWVLLAAGLWLVWPSSLGGCTTLTVVSGHSMEPTYYTGDLVVARCGTPKVGDVAVYRPAAVDRSARIIHRVVGGDGASGWQLKGDNNTYADPFSPTNADVVGVAVLHIPKLGRLSVLLLNPWLWAFAVLAAMVLLIWPSAEDEPHDDDTRADAAPSGVADEVAEVVTVGTVDVAGDVSVDRRPVAVDHAR